MLHKSMTLRELPTDPDFNTSTHNLLKVFYIPALERSTAYDRGVGFFTSKWLKMAAMGLAQLAANGGRARIIASPILGPEDSAALNQGAEARNDPVLRQALESAISDLERDLEHDTLAALAWMVADGLLEFKIAIPTGELDGDFHDKFGIFQDAVGDSVAFHGSQNDSAKAFRNYESISVFYSWLDEREGMRVQSEKKRFQLIWSNGDINLRAYDFPDAVRRNLIEFTARSERPYSLPNDTSAVSPNGDARWQHQRDAVSAFLKARHGILEMATGTGKTRTAITILLELHERGLIDVVIVAAFGTDLLDQWHKELLRRLPLPIFRQYERHREAQSFLNHPSGAILLTSRQMLAEVLSKLKPSLYPKVLLVCDEAHGMGSATLVQTLRGRISKLGFTLGLSATPDREYDGDGNQFIEQEIGPVIFNFSLKDAIQKGILCEFDYIPLEYTLSEDDRAEIRQAIRRYHAKVGAGEPVAIEVLYQEISKIRKLSKEKLPLFRAYANRNPETLHRCLIFVETAGYGLHVQDTLMELRVDFHTYYGDDDRTNLTKFAKKELDCLITCHRISEGIDIQSVNNIILFASSRARLETVQRLGRCLRIDPMNPHKRAKVLDFVDIAAGDQNGPAVIPNADEERRVWFRDLASTTRTQL